MAPKAAMSGLKSTVAKAKAGGTGSSTLKQAGSMALKQGGSARNSSKELSSKPPTKRESEKKLSKEIDQKVANESLASLNKKDEATASQAGSKETDEQKTRAEGDQDEGKDGPSKNHDTNGAANGDAAIGEDDAWSCDMDVVDYWNETLQELASDQKSETMYIRQFLMKVEKEALPDDGVRPFLCIQDYLVLKHRLEQVEIVTNVVLPPAASSSSSSSGPTSKVFVTNPLLTKELVEACEAYDVPDEIIYQARKIAEDHVKYSEQSRIARKQETLAAAKDRQGKEQKKFDDECAALKDRLFSANTFERAVGNDDIPTANKCLSETPWLLDMQLPGTNCTALEIAMRSEDSSNSDKTNAMLDLLLKQGAHCNFASDMDVESMLWKAVGSKRLPEVKSLLQYGADPRVGCPERYLPGAAERANLDQKILQLIEKREGDLEVKKIIKRPSAQSLGPQSILRGLPLPWPRLCKLILSPSYGPSTNDEKKESQTIAKQEAIEQFHKLFSWNPNQSGKEAGDTTDTDVERQSVALLDLIMWLYPESVDLPIDMRTGRTMLHYACDRLGDGLHPNLSMVKMLLCRRADPNVGDVNGCTPISLAVQGSHKELCQILTGSSWSIVAPISTPRGVTYTTGGGPNTDREPVIADSNTGNSYHICLSERVELYCVHPEQRALPALRNKDDKSPVEFCVKGLDAENPKALRFKMWFTEFFTPLELGDFRAGSKSRSFANAGGGDAPMVKLTAEDVLSEANLSGPSGNLVGGSQRAQQDVTQQLKGMSAGQLRDKGQNYQELKEARERMDVLKISD